MSSTPAAAPNPATVQALRIFDFELDKNNPNPAKGQFVKVDPKTERFLILAASASMALDLLHSRAGYRALQTCAKVTIEDTAKEHRAGRLVENSGEYTQEFLASVRKNFPVLVIRNLDAMNGRSTKHDWHDANPKHYVPASAGIVEVNRLLLVRAYIARTSFLNASIDVARARDRRERDSLEKIRNEARDSLYGLVLRLGITLAHEICHLQTSFLLHLTNAPTPPRAGYGSYYVSESRGEAGRYWEYLTFGGYIDMQGEKESSYRVAVAVRGADEVRVWKILPLTARRLVQKRDFSCLPLVDSYYSYEADEVAKIDSHEWSAKYCDIFKGKRKIGRDGRHIPAYEIPKDKQRSIIVAPVNEEAYCVWGRPILHWLLNQPDPQRGFEGAERRLMRLPAN